MDWLEGEDATYRARTVQALCDLLSDGLAVDPARSYAPPISARAFLPPPPAAFDREGQAGAKRDQPLHLLLGRAG